MFNIIENGKVIHTAINKTLADQWAFVLKNTQGRIVSVERKVS